MSQENVEVVRDIYERWREGDFRASVDVFDPLVLFVMRREFPDAGAYLGLERFAEYTRGFLEPWSRITIAAEDITDAEAPRVLTPPHSGRRVGLIQPGRSSP